MNIINHKMLIKGAQYSLSFLWIFSGLTSIYFSPEVGYEILASSNITGQLAYNAIYAGGILDLAIGVWLFTSFKVRYCCIIQVVIIVIYTLLLTFIDASFWLHPFGPITKNIPIIVLIGFVYIGRLQQAQPALPKVNEK